MAHSQLMKAYLHYVINAEETDKLYGYSTIIKMLENIKITLKYLHKECI